MHSGVKLVSVLRKSDSTLLCKTTRAQLGICMVLEYCPNLPPIEKLIGAVLTGWGAGAADTSEQYEVTPEPDQIEWVLWM